MKFTFQQLLWLLISTLMTVALILSHADAKNQTYIEMEATEAILKAPPAGYITPAIQTAIRDNLVNTRHLDPAKLTISGTTNIANRKVKGSGDETISLQISYPRVIYIFFGSVINDSYIVPRTINTEYHP
ncbi:hypothetical protein [Paenibacillus sp. yr247]|uniref:hypothetical protein n=1 Tax=Paenibacillus sp. yr247 TaxID=1761880 RepID=UPI00113FF56E|nr:hypothetical protein [Paenibacillus sp. yr247]